MNAPRAAVCFLAGVMASGCGVVVSPDESRLRVFTAGDASLVDLGPADAGAPGDASPPPPDASREDIAADLGDDAAAPHDLGPADDVSDVPVSPDVAKALAAREAEAERLREREARAYVEATLFDMVHGKYKEREAQIRGWIKPSVLEAHAE